MDSRGMDMQRDIISRIHMEEYVDDRQLLQVIDEVIAERHKSEGFSLNQKLMYRREIYHAIRGLDVLEDLLEDPTVTEIMINGFQNIFIERNGKILRYCKEFQSEEKLFGIIQKMVAKANRIVNETTPVVDARLSDGSRINVVLPPVSLVGPVLTIRKFPRKYRMDDLVNVGTLTGDCAAFLMQAVIARMNIFISGGTGTGKTTFLNALSGFIPKQERIITIEDSAELQLQHPNLVRLEARAGNMEGKNEIRIRELIRTALRMRPDRIIVGEVRSEEALDMLQAMNTGHDGSISTGHANSPEDMLYRLEIMTLLACDIPLEAVRGQIAAAIDIMVHLERKGDGSRRVTSVFEICGYEKGRIILKELFRYDDEKGELVKTEEECGKLGKRMRGL